MTIGIIIIVSLSCYTGIVIFAAFYDCDPIRTKVQDPSLPLLSSSIKYSETNSRVTANKKIGPTPTVFRDGDDRVDSRIAWTIRRGSV